MQDDYNKIEEMQDNDNAYLLDLSILLLKIRFHQM